MAREVKAGSWMFRISDNQKELQKSALGGSSYSHLWSAPNGERILDLIAKGEEVEIRTDRHNYIRTKSGNINLK